MLFQQAVFLQKSKNANEALSALTASPPLPIFSSVNKGLSFLSVVTPWH
jgi:hypothetical protein